MHALYFCKLLYRQYAPYQRGVHGQAVSDTMILTADYAKWRLGHHHPAAGTTYTN